MKADNNARTAGEVDQLIFSPDVPRTGVSANSMRAVARFAWTTLAYNIAVILWGAFVRATGSGAGCGNHWPLCTGDVLPRTPQAQTLIEFTHRVTSALALVLVSVLVVWCWRKTSKRQWPRYSALLALVFLLNEALLGALLVLLNHVAQDRSAARAVFLSLHFGNTLLLLTSLTVTAGWLWHENRYLKVIGTPSEIVMIVLGLVATMSIGITGSLAALGDTLFPVTSLQSALLQDFSSGTQSLLRWRLLHPFVAVIGAIYVLWIIRRISIKRGQSSRTIAVLAGTFIVQAGLGVMNVILLAPVWLQIVHLFVAELFWILVVLASADLLFEAAARHTDALLESNYCSLLHPRP